MFKCDSSEKISEEELLKLLDTFRAKKINYKIIFKLCNVKKLLDLNMHQFNYLMYLVSRR